MVVATVPAISRAWRTEGRGFGPIRAVELSADGRYLFLAEIGGATRGC
jgi:hypothetical protein